MTNNLLEKWQYFMKDICSPQSFIDFGFYFMISAALQRRVWTGPFERPLFPNLYIVLVGDAAVGKGMTLRPVGDILKYWKKGNLKAATNAEKIISDAVEVTQETLTKNQSGELVDKKIIDDLLFPVTANNSSYQALVNRMARSIRNITYSKINPETKSNVLAVYTHSSLNCILEEFASLIHENSKQIVDFLLEAYDCGDYTYETITRQEDRIRRCCLNIIAGTTPEFMQEAFSSEILRQGISSRTFFIYETAPRFYKFKLPDFTKEQLQCYTDILAHIKELGRLYGQATFTPDAEEYMRHLFEEVYPYKRPNNSAKLGPFYGRMNIHMQKMASAVHFSRHTTDMVITLDEAEEAVRLLESILKNMHHALDVGGSNPLSRTQKAILKFMAKVNQPMTFNDLWIEFVGDVRETELQECLRFLAATDQIVMQQTLTKTKQEVYTYQLKRNKNIEVVTKKQLEKEYKQKEEPANVIVEIKAGVENLVEQDMQKPEAKPKESIKEFVVEKPAA